MKYRESTLRYGQNPLIAKAIAAGWIRMPIAVVSPSKSSEYVKNHVYRLRQKRIAQGLTINGTPRKRKAWPQLRGLNRTDYKTQYMRLIRGSVPRVLIVDDQDRRTRNRDCMRRLRARRRAAGLNSKGKPFGGRK